LNELKNNISSILITGGAGYIGSVLTAKLVSNGYNVKVLDSLIFGNDGISEFISNNSIELIYGDIRDKEILEKSTKNVDCVIHLASIVGEPLCKKIPEAAKQINELATSKLVEICKLNDVHRFIYSSTCSNYGTSLDIVNETSPVNALSLYSETKIKSESIVLKSKNSNFESCVLRFATAFGISPRMRFDLLLQEFIHDAIIDNKIIIFGPDYWRPLVHVNDIANACILAITSPSNLISGEIYNVGNTNQNHTKHELAKTIQSYLPNTKIEIHKLKKDPRNYRVSFEKIHKNLGFVTTKTVSDGIKEILDQIKNKKLNPSDTSFSNISKFTENVKIFE